MATEFHSTYYHVHITFSGREIRGLRRLANEADGKDRRADGARQAGAVENAADVCQLQLVSNAKTEIWGFDIIRRGIIGYSLKKSKHEPRIYEEKFLSILIMLKFEDKS